MKLFTFVPRILLGALCAASVLLGSAGAQPYGGPAQQRLPQIPRKTPEAQALEKLNAWTVGLAGGQLEGAPIRFATEIARVVDDGDNLHVLPIVTRGPAGVRPDRSSSGLGTASPAVAVSEPRRRRALTGPATEAGAIGAAGLGRVRSGTGGRDTGASPCQVRLKKSAWSDT